MSTINLTSYNNNSFSAPPARDEQLNLYKMLGGEPIIRAAVQAVSKRMLSDSFLSFFVNKQDLDASQEYLVEFFSISLAHGVPDDTSTIDEAVVDSLSRLFILGLNAQHFDVILGYLVLSLDSFGVHRAVVVEVVRALRPLRTSFERGAKAARSKHVSARFSLAL